MNLFVGIDVSKDSFSVTGIDPDGNLLFSFTTVSDCSGFQNLMKSISTHCKGVPLQSYSFYKKRNKTNSSFHFPRTAIPL